jgi:phosphoglycerate dehydrogenase-like enzyme
MLMTARRLTAIIDGVRAGRWPRDAGHELRGATLGLLGYGPSGRAVARLGVAFGMTVLVNTAHPDPAETGVEFVDRDTVVAAADYLSLHTRSDATTHRMIGRDRLRAMKTTAILINTARGSLVDEDALADALHSGQIAGAALDVLDAEPLPASSRLRGLDNVIITSHLAGQTAEARARAALAAAHAVLDVLDGREPNHPIDRS